MPHICSREQFFESNGYFCGSGINTAIGNRNSLGRETRRRTRMKIGAITFHGSHNYGSMLQAYALQEYVKKLLYSYHIPCDYQIINYRSEAQKNIYQAPKPDNQRIWSNGLCIFRIKSSLTTQHRKFEAFITDHLHPTEEFSFPIVYLRLLPALTS